MPNQPPAAPPAPVPEGRVAVLVVHGVADQAPHESARAIVDLLATLNSPAHQAYGGFVEDDLRIDVEPPANGKRVTEGFTRVAQVLAERARAAGEAAAGDKAGGKAGDSGDAGDTAGTSDPTLDPGVAFMRDLLAGHAPATPHTAYRTVRLRGRRLAGSPRVLDVYEMYWADLSRLGTGVVRMLGELYQILFHVSSLGRHVADAAAIADARDNRAWSILRTAHAVAAYVLTVAAPFLNLWMLASVAVGAAVVAVDALPPAARPVPVLAAAVFGALGLLAIRRVGSNLPILAWCLVPVAAVALAGAAYRFVEPIALRATSCAALAAIWIAGEWIVRYYERLRPEAGRFGSTSLGLFVLGMGMSLALARGGLGDILTACLWVVEIVFLVSAIPWALFFTMQLVAGVAGQVARRSVSDAAARLRLVRADRTVRLSLALPAVAFILITMTLWAGLFVTASRVIPPACYPPIWIETVSRTPPTPDAVTACGPMAGPSAMTHADAAWVLIETAAPEVLALMCIVGVTMLIAIWSALPSIAAEVRPPAATSQAAPTGEWLDRGFRFLWVAGLLLVAGCALTVAAVGAHLWVLGAATESGGPSWLRWPEPPGVVRWYVDHAAWLLKGVGAAVAGTALGMVAFGGRLKRLTGGLRPFLDVLLDVDNYLREHPKADNPRSRIVSRYVSLLRYVCKCSDEQGRGYDSLVIVSHSQGTVITADLLRYLSAWPDPALAPLGSRIPVHIVTMGSPLRQLYGRRFPHLYAWAHHADTELPDSPLPRTREPLLAPLKVASWTNLYCSGDYVGRYLWYREASPERWNVAASAALAAPPADPRRERCVGDGAHTHYWDATSGTVARALDEVVGW